MILEHKIRGFKKFTEETLRMAPLTVLTGMNGAGKTSVIHSLLLAREAAQHGNNQVVRLNGPYELELGTFEDIHNWDVFDPVQFELTDDKGKVFKWELNADPTALYADVKQFPHELPTAFTSTGRKFQYLSAERFGPRTLLASSALPPTLMEVGCRGQFTAQVLHTLDSMPIDKARSCPSSEPDDISLLKFEVERWLSRIARPIQIDTESLATKTATALRFRPSGDSEWVRAPNMGFGVTYALPVVLAGLILEQDGLLIVENPEAHLHPAGQSNIGQYLATIAAAGVQVLVETHSDHVLNGIRLAIGEKQILAATDAVVHFFDFDDSSPHLLTFTETGGMNSWPPGFFDQYQLDVSKLTRVRRSR